MATAGRGSDAFGLSAPFALVGNLKLPSGALTCTSHVPLLQRLCRVYIFRFELA
jgi:hypothetical protein